MPDLNDWLRQFGLEALSGILTDNDVDLEILPDLTEQDFEKLGISLGNRRKLLKAVASLREPPSFVAPATPATPWAGRRNGRSRGRAPAGYRSIQRSCRFDCPGHRARSRGLEPLDQALSRRLRWRGRSISTVMSRNSWATAYWLISAIRKRMRTTPNVRCAPHWRSSRRCDRSSGRMAPAGNARRHRHRSGRGRRYHRHRRRARRVDRRGDAQSRRPPAKLGRAQHSFGGRRHLPFDRADVRIRRLRRAPPQRLCQADSGLAGITRSASASRFAAARDAGLGPFVGRGQEMGLLLERWRQAQQGEGQAVVLTAEPGMGKSRLVEALFDRVGKEAQRRIVLQCSPYHSNTAFYPVLRQIEQAAGFAHEHSTGQNSTARRLAGRRRQQAPSLVPLLADLLSLPRQGRYPPLELTPAQRKNAVLSALVDRLLRFSEREPLLFVLEDAHWIDPTTLELLTRFIDSSARHARSSSSPPVLNSLRRGQAATTSLRSRWAGSARPNAPRSSPASPPLNP